MRRVLTLTVLAVVACGGAGDDGATSTSTGTGATSTGDASTTGATPTTGGADTSTSGADGSSGAGESSSSTGADPFGGPSVCSRGQEWNMGNKESPFMNPGLGCQTCHAKLAPNVNGRILVGGTVYMTGHEPDLCFGIDGVKTPMFVEITDATMKVTQLPVNQGGNFLWDRFELGAITFPITARVVNGDLERVMLTPQMDGDCNRCHSETGTNAAPGRIVAP